MTRQLSKRLQQLALGFLAALLLAGFWSTAGMAQTRAPALAYVRVGQFIPNESLTVQFQLAGQGSASQQTNGQNPMPVSDLGYEQISDYQPLPAGRYTLTVRSQETVLLCSTYGLGAGDRYTLTLYGIVPTSPTTNPQTLMARLQNIVGGVDAHGANGHLPQMTLLHDKVSSQTNAPQVRLMHLAPGLVPLDLTVQSPSQTLFTQTLAYPMTSEVQSIEGGDTDLAMAVHEGKVAITQQLLALKSQTLTDIFVVGGLAAPQPVKIIVADPTSSQS